jgi:hypothetical protein
MLSTRTSERSGRLIDNDETASMEKKKREGYFLMTTYAPQQVSVSSGGQVGPQKDLLCFLTCGSVDDGKSTFIGRLLYDTKRILEDQLAALECDSRKHGTTGEDIAFALLVDGLEAERAHHDRRGVPVLRYAPPGILRPKRHPA